MISPSTKQWGHRSSDIRERGRMGKPCPTAISKPLENPTARESRAGSGELGRESCGSGKRGAGPEKPKQSARREPAKRTGAREAKGTARPTASAPASSCRWPALPEPGSRSPQQAGRLPARPLETPFKETGDQKGRLAPAATRLPASQPHRSASVLQPPLTRMEAATTWAAAATRHFPAGLCPAQLARSS